MYANWVTALFLNCVFEDISESLVITGDVESDAELADGTGVVHLSIRLRKDTYKKIIVFAFLETFSETDANLFGLLVEADSEMAETE